MTLGSRERIAGSGSASRVSRPYGLSSTTSTPASAQHSMIRRLRSTGCVTPDGLLKFGIVYRNLMRFPCSRSLLAVSVMASGIRPSPSQATCTTSA